MWNVEQQRGSAMPAVPTTEAPVKLPLETVTPIRPSEAIRLGMLTHPIQSFGHIGSGNTACALGAMAVGYGDEEARNGYVSLAGKMPLYLDPPCRCDNRDTLHLFGRSAEQWHALDAVWHLNDSHRWARESIADWLEQQGL